MHARRYHGNVGGQLSWVYGGAESFFFLALVICGFFVKRIKLDLRILQPLALFRVRFEFQRGAVRGYGVVGLVRICNQGFGEEGG